MAGRRVVGPRRTWPRRPPRAGGDGPRDDAELQCWNASTPLPSGRRRRRKRAVVATKTTTRVDDRSRRWVEVEVEVAVVVGAMASVRVFSVDVLGFYWLWSVWRIDFLPRGSVWLFCGENNNIISLHIAHIIITNIPDTLSLPYHRIPWSRFEMSASHKSFSGMTDRYTYYFGQEPIQIQGPTMALLRPTVLLGENIISLLIATLSLHFRHPIPIIPGS